MSRIKAVIFDKDGTLIDTEPLHLRMWVSIMKERGFPATDEIFKQCIGLNYHSIDALLKTCFGETFDIADHYEYVNEKVREYELEHGIVLKDGFYELSDYLIEQNIPSAIATSSMHAEAEFCLEQLGISDRFSAVVGGDEIENGKPSPDIFLKAASLLGFEPSECLVFEDSSNGVKAALAAGMRCVYIPDMKEIEEELQEKTIKLRSLDEAINIIKEFNKEEQLCRISHLKC